MGYFSDVRRMWDDSGVGSCIEGIAREGERGNMLEAQKWYFKLKKECHRLSVKEGVLPSAIEKRGLDNAGPDLAMRYRAIVERGTRPGGPFVEIDEWLKHNRPV